MALVLAQAGGTSQLADALILGVIFFLMTMWISSAVSRKEDKAWLGTYVLWGFLAKMFGSLARYYMVAVLYGTGDSLAYHNAGQTFASVWRSFHIPVSDAGSAGTAFTEVVTGFIYAIYTPTFLGSFLIFAMLSFIGQLLFYLAFRPWMNPAKRKLYALAIFFLPSLIFWPSSPGKDALMVLFLGAASYGASRLLRGYSFAALLIMVPALYLAVNIRPHIAGVFGIALVLALLFGKSSRKERGSPKRPVLLLLAGIGAFAILAVFASTFAISLDGGGGFGTTDLGGFLSDVSEQTATGGSQISGGSIASPAEIPLAIVTVLFRPLIYEGTSPQVIMSALEGTALLLLVVVKMPQMWRNKGLLREKPYLLLCFFYTGGFVLGFSAVLNLGILARQRVQVLPMFLALIVALGWPEVDPEEQGAKKRKTAPPRPIRPSPRR